MYYQFIKTHFVHHYSFLFSEMKRLHVELWIIAVHYNQMLN